MISILDYINQVFALTFFSVAESERTRASKIQPLVDECWTCIDSDKNIEEGENGGEMGRSFVTTGRP